jgi:hypothetical protein
MFEMKPDKKIIKSALISSPPGKWEGATVQTKRIFTTRSLATASFMVPKFLKAFERVDRVPAGNKVMVILQLSGGNDGLNT